MTPTLPRLWPAWLLLIWAGLVGWAALWPLTADGDAALHYLNLQETMRVPRLGLTSWARPGYVLAMLLPAQGGLLALRAAQALLTVLLCDQTVRLARDLQLPQPWLAAPLLLFQHQVFPLASDMMTELPMALCLTIAVRLWLADRLLSSALMIAYSATVRPEGVFVGVGWGAVLLLGGASWYAGQAPSWRRRLAAIALLPTGVLAWVAVSWWVTGDPLYLKNSFSWPFKGRYEQFGTGSLFHHVIRWPLYCGPVLLPLFLLGLGASGRRALRMPLLVWAIVFGVHSILWWRGWFASLGLMRIQTCSASTTALLALAGWQQLSAAWPRLQQRAAALALTALAASTACWATWADAEQHRTHDWVRAVEAARPALDAGATVFCGDPALKVLVGRLDMDDDLLANDMSDPEAFLERAAQLPAGSIGLWDDGKGRWWYSLTIEQLEAAGYEVVLDLRREVPAPPWLHWLTWQTRQQRTVVLRKR